MFLESGPIGLELAPPHWTLVSTHPPVSALGLPIGARLVAIDHELVSEETSSHLLHRLLHKRPLCLTLQVSPQPPTYLHAFAEAMGSAVIARRIHQPYTSMPPPFYKSTRQRPWKLLAHGANPCLYALMTACVVMLDDEALARVGMTCTAANAHFSYRLNRYIWRRRLAKKPQQSPHFANSESELFIKYGTSVPACISVFDSKFYQLVEALTPACFTHNAPFTKYLRSEGVCLEILFVDLVLRVAMNDSSSPVAEHLSSIFANEGADCVVWLRIFLVLMSEFAKFVKGGRGRDIHADALVHLSVAAVDDSVILASTQIPVSRKWIRFWIAAEGIRDKGAI